MQTANEVTSPSRRTRQQEKEELQHLNDRFVTYIDHVRRLREEKTRVDSAYEFLQNTSFEESSKVKRVYDRELDDARLLIDETAKEKARFQLQASKNADRLATLEAELKEVSDEFSKIQEELADAKLNVENSERQRCSLNQERVSSQHKIQEMEDELDDLRTEVKRLRELLEQETLLKVDLKNQIQSLKEDSVFRKKVYEEEIFKKRTEVISDGARMGGDVEETDGDFSERLQAAIDDAREEIDKETEQYRTDLEKAYRAKLDMLDKQTRLDSATITKQSIEIRQLNSSLVQTNKTVSSLQDDKDRLEILLRERMEELGIVKEQHSDEVSRVMQDMRMLRVNYEEKITEYEQLLDLRVKLEQEIATLSALLQEEESRLNISATPTRDKRKRPADRDGPKTKKKKQVDVKSSSSAGFIQICDVDPDGRYVEIKNMSEKIEALGSFKIVHEVIDTGEKMEFRFHNKSKLQAGASVTVWAHDAEGATHNPPTEIIWKNAPNWGSGSQTLTTLCTKNGDVVATFTQRKETSITETTQDNIVLDQTDSGSKSFPYIPASSPERVWQTERTSTPAVWPRPPPQQEDPVGERNRANRERENCVVC